MNHTYLSEKEKELMKYQKKEYPKIEPIKYTRPFMSEGAISDLEDFDEDELWN